MERVDIDLWRLVAACGEGLVRFSGCALLAIAVVAAVTPVYAQFQRVEHFEKPDLRPPVRSPASIKYGDRYWQRVNFYPAERTGKAPVAVILHGAWPSPMGLYPTSWMRYRLNRAGYAVAVIDYDSDEAGAEGTLRDIVRAIAVLRDQSARRDIDTERLLLVGVGGGGHLATLLGTDESYFERGGIPFPSLKMVVSVNGDGFDIPRRMASTTRYRASRYEEFFGTAPSVQAALSPVLHLGAPNAPGFLFLAVENEETIVAHSEEMVAALKSVGAEAQILMLPKFRDGSLSTYFMADGNDSTVRIIELIDAVVSSG